MNDLKKIFLYISVPILPLLLIIFLVEIRTNIALNDYSMLPDGVKVVDKVVLGRRERTFSEGLEHAYNLEFSDGIDKAFRRGAIELVCTNRGNILLIMKDYKGGGHSVGPSLSDRGSLNIDDGSLRGGRVEIKKVNFLSREYFDTLASTPLSKQEINSIFKALKKRKATRIGLSTMDGGNAFAGNTEVSQVKKLIDNCQPSTKID